MTDHKQASSYIARHRYTIKELMDISSTTYGTFDLSNFSYEAARAGVIPQLNRCAMASCKTSSQQPRDRSDDSTSNDEIMHQPGNFNDVQPLRTPIVPPSELRTQEDLGFVRFLKKHSSPTHQRVTAGGRIVPMHKRFSPPMLSLRPKFPEEGHQKKPLGRAELGPMKHHTSPDLRSAITTVPDGARSEPMITQYAAQHLPDSFVSIQRDDQALNHNRADLGIGLAQESLPQSLYLPATHMHAPTTTITSEASPHLSLPPQGNERRVFTSQDVIDQQMVAAQKSLCYWSQCFDELDVQLKTLDRQRAMTSLTTEMANQRKAIVQQRSDTKDIIAKIKAFLGMSEQATALYKQGRFNVNAPAYVPQRESSAGRSAGIADAKSSKTTGESSYIQPPGVRRPIPIVAPPDLKAQETTPMQSPLKKIVRDSVDQWGVRVGDAPLELQRKQSEMATSVVEDISPGHSTPNKGPHNFKTNQIRSFSENDAYQSSYGESSSDNELPCIDLSDRPPPAIEADYMRQLDALRLPKGTCTAVRLSHGSTIRVEGQDLQRPCSPRMSDFEKQYWATVPNVEHITSSTVPSSSCKNLVNHLSISSMLAHSAHTNFSPKQNRVQATIAVTDSYWPGNNVSNREGDSVVTPAAAAKNIVSSWKHPSPTQQSQLDQLRFENQRPSLDAFGNKGYTSSAVQNVHAAAPFPFLDGVSEPGQGMRSLIGLASKPKSPRVLQRAGRDGNAWFGPFRRGLNE